jgi:hypothetical protein
MLGSSSGPDFRDAPPTEPILRATIAQLVAVFGLRACWYEPFPFDTLLPRIEDGRIILPAEEPGIEAWSLGAGVELPVRHSGLTLGRFVLVLEAGSSPAGTGLSPPRRAEAISIATRVGTLIAAEMLAEPSGTVVPRDDAPTGAGARRPRRGPMFQLRRSTRRGEGHHE